MNKYLNIISFDVPYPPNYGGVIDVFYKLKALHKLGVKIILHTFEYGRGENKELNKYCDKIYYYKRNSKIKSSISKIPFIVKTRANNSLIENLKLNDFTILFEGLHTTYPLVISEFKDRTKLLRMHNIEHHYYKGLSKSEENSFKKIYFTFEAAKLKNYESILDKANYILSISPLEHLYFSTKFPSKTKYIPAFHQHNFIKSSEGIGDYALYHGDLRVADNLKSCSFLIDVFSEIDYPLVIASSTINKKMSTRIKKHTNINFIDITNNNQLEELLNNAHINVLPTFQNTGIKLKLLNALYSGRFCIVNNEMILKTGLEDLCIIANTKKEFQEKIKEYSLINFKKEDIIKREKILKNLNTNTSALEILKLI